MQRTLWDEAETGSSSHLARATSNQVMYALDRADVFHLYSDSTDGLDLGTQLIADAKIALKPFRDTAWCLRENGRGREAKEVFEGMLKGIHAYSQIPHSTFSYWEFPPVLERVLVDLAAEWLQVGLDGDSRTMVDAFIAKLVESSMAPSLTGEERPLAAICGAMASEAEPPSEPCPGALWKNELGMEFVWCPPGEFLMGSTEDEETVVWEYPQHRVVISRGFWLGRYPVTQEQWGKLMRENPSVFKGPRHPVENVSWNECDHFCAEMSELIGGRYRFPYEAEWEYACRAGTMTPRYGPIDSVAWYHVNSGWETCDVGCLEGNTWGLHDMLGNVWEWCEDWFDEDYYASAPKQDPSGPSSGTERVVRGGGYCQTDWDCRAACRSGDRPGFRADFLGFRVLRESG